MKLLFTILLAFLSVTSGHAMSIVEEIAAKHAALASPGPGPMHPLATSASFSGSLDPADPEWMRAFANGTCCSGLGPVKYDVQTFYVTAGATCSISSTQNGYDGYLFVYRSPFDASAQTTNFVAGDDDGNGGIGTSDIDNVVLQANTDYVVVSTGFENGEVGSYTNTISCSTGNVILDSVANAPVSIPTLQTWGVLLLSGLLVLFVGFQRRRNKSF